MIKTKTIHFISRVFAIASGIVVGLMMLLTVADVFMRFFFNSPITGATEITEFMMICVVFLALAWCALTKMHVKVSLLVSNFSNKAQTIIDIITLTATLIICAIITWRSLLESISTYKNHIASSLINLPYYPFKLIMTLGFAVFCLAITALIAEKIGALIKGK